MGIWIYLVISFQKLSYYQPFLGKTGFVLSLGGRETTVRTCLLDKLVMMLVNHNFKISLKATHTP